MIETLKLYKEKVRDQGFEPPYFVSHPIFRSVYTHLLACMASGLLLALAFPGFKQAILAFVGLVPLMYAVQSASVRRAAWMGLLAGFVFFGVSLSWLYNLGNMVEGVGLKLCAVLGTLVLSLYCALYFVPISVVSAIATKRWLGNNLRKNMRFMFVITVVWVGSEYLRGVILTGFPWNQLGISQFESTTIIQSARWGGVYAVSAMIVWMNAALFCTLRQYTHGTRTRKYRPHFELLIGLVPVALSLSDGLGTILSRTPGGEPVSVALVQPNISQSVKWDAAREEAIRDRLEELTYDVLKLRGIDLIVWPETAVPDILNNPRTPDSYMLVQQLVREGVPILVGAMDYVSDGERNRYFNSSILFDGDGDAIGRYSKQHLVPFGEYVPFPGLMRKFTPIDIDFGAGRESSLLQVPGTAPFSVLICFEDTIAPLASKAVRSGARWLVNQTNDAWFDPSSQSEQHLAHAVFRCVENQVPMARCCNTGTTGIIDAQGSISYDADAETRMDVRIEGFLVASIEPRPEGLPPTFYACYGDAFARCCLVAALVSAFVLCWGRRKRRAA